MEHNEVIKRIEDAEAERIKKINERIGNKITIQNIRHLGKVNNLDIYRLSEKDARDNYSKAIYKYYDENAKLKGIKSLRAKGRQEWVPSDDEEWNKIRDEIDKNEKQVEELLEEIADALEISKNEIDKITEIDIAEPIMRRKKEEKDKHKENEINKDDKRRDKNDEQEDIKDNNKENKGPTRDLKNVRQEVSTDTKVDKKGHTIATELNLDKYYKIAIVHAHEFQNMVDENGRKVNVPTKAFGLVGFREEEGKQIVEPLMDYYRGSNNNAVAYDGNKGQVKKIQPEARFVNPHTNKGIALEEVTGGSHPEVHFQYGIDVDDNTPVMLKAEDRFSGKNVTDSDVLEIVNNTKGRLQPDRLNNDMKKHEDYHKGPIDWRRADGIEDEDDHKHNFNRNERDQIIEELMNDDDVKAMFTTKDINKMLDNYIEKNKVEGLKQEDIEKFKNNVKKDAETLRRTTKSKRLKILG